MDSSPAASGAFSNNRQFLSWKKQKLNGYGAEYTNTPVNIADPFRIREDEYNHLVEQVQRRNFVLYRLNPEYSESPQAIMALCRQLGLVSTIGNPESGKNHISCITDRTQDPENFSRYIPYTTKPLNWHTDGYYYPENRKVRSFVMHCVNPAESGGENSLIDHEMLYIQMQEQAPDLIACLSLPDTLKIPENIDQGQTLRDAFEGPVYSLDENDHLYMRFTQRKHHIIWKQDPKVSQAIETLNALLSGPLLGKMTILLAKGEGILCNNIVHCRHAYTDSESKKVKRLLYRIRFNERIGMF
ncbi:MAG: TauD/TfdA family dioxygenase [Gammaproteobacteria bacterium]|nr:TauD/TfdA family dioxygenase [Gammaproteobacteria bacterium]MCY4227612.1 TauD/TfdA family dioxygenase [Gammaproteobacteria bacterium]